MTPIIKAYCSEMGFRVCETAVQCLGGYGYCREYPLEQYLRDAKIMSLYEGTNGIQAMDLMGRKMTIRDGACLKAFQRRGRSLLRRARRPPAAERTDRGAQGDEPDACGLPRRRCGDAGKKTPSSGPPTHTRR